MREVLSYWLANVVMLGSVCLALHWIWQAFLIVIGVRYEKTEDEED